jgi:diguanylate cyclase (GGDEF)-like protein
MKNTCYLENIGYTITKRFGNINIEKKKLKILIVDDEIININILAEYFESQYEVIYATNGESALKIIQEQVPDLILLDIMMPGMDGFDVLEKIKNTPSIMSIPVIFITGSNDAKSEEKGLVLGAVDYITKPFNPSIIKARINTQLKLSEYINTIEKQCLLDALTGLPNRRGFDNRFDIEWARAFREKTPLGMIMFDIDYFKNYNDTYGHPQGDVLLKIISDIIYNTINRATDFASRWGGEEFIVLLPGSDKDGTYNVAEQIRINIKNAQIPHSDGSISTTTISGGGLSIIPSEEDSINGMIKTADDLLYLAKDNGRDQVCMDFPQ